MTFFDDIKINNRKVYILFTNGIYVFYDHFYAVIAIAKQQQPWSDDHDVTTVNLYTGNHELTGNMTFTNDKVLKAVKSYLTKKLHEVYRTVNYNMIDKDLCHVSLYVDFISSETGEYITF